MATVYRCDRCFREDDRPLFRVTIPHMNQSYMPRDTDDTFTKDLCDNCVRQLDQWIQPPPQKA